MFAATIDELRSALADARIVLGLPPLSYNQPVLYPDQSFISRSDVQELRDGVACVEALIECLPALSAVVLVGNRAAKAEPYLRDKSLELFKSSHPGPLVKARYPERWEAIPLQWAEVMKVRPAAV